jgi:hypothetical protein
MQLKKKGRKEAGEYDWKGAYMPGTYYFGVCKTFSVGIFQWENTQHGLRKSAVKFRIKGYISNPDDVLAAAEKWCDDLDNGAQLPGTKTITIKRKVK